jgi:hypothetical protein
VKLKRVVRAMFKASTVQMGDGRQTLFWQDK